MESLPSCRPCFSAGAELIPCGGLLLLLHDVEQVDPHGTRGERPLGTREKRLLRHGVELLQLGVALLWLGVELLLLDIDVERWPLTWSAGHSLGVGVEPLWLGVVLLLFDIDTIELLWPLPLGVEPLWMSCHSPGALATHLEPASA